MKYIKFRGNIIQGTPIRSISAHEISTHKEIGVKIEYVDGYEWIMKLGNYNNDCSRQKLVDEAGVAIKELQVKLGLEVTE